MLQNIKWKRMETSLMNIHLGVITLQNTKHTKKTNETYFLPDEFFIAS